MAGNTTFWAISPEVWAQLDDQHLCEINANTMSVIYNRIIVSPVRIVITLFVSRPLSHQRVATVKKAAGEQTSKSELR